MPRQGSVRASVIRRHSGRTPGRDRVVATVDARGGAHLVVLAPPGSPRVWPDCTGRGVDRSSTCPVLAGRGRHISADAGRLMRLQSRFSFTQRLSQSPELRRTTAERYAPMRPLNILQAIHHRRASRYPGDRAATGFRALVRPSCRTSTRQRSPHCTHTCRPRVSD